MTATSALKAIPSGVAISHKISPPHLVAENFPSLYPNRIQAILRPRGRRTWTTVSKHWAMPDETILAAVNGSEQNFFGLRWGEYTRFAVLDIDIKSRYHCFGELRLLQERLAAVGLSAMLYQSSDSGGWHVYLFFDDWANSANVNETLSRWLRAHGYTIKGGVLEVFPSGCGLRLPLQPGFAWLDPEGLVIRTREESTRDEAIASFLTDLQENQKNWSEAKNRIESELVEIDRVRRGDALAHEKAIDIEGFDDLYKYRLIAEKYEEGRRYWQTGLTGRGQRHDAILAVQHYLWHGDKIAGVPAMPATTNDEVRYRLILAWLQKKHNGFCNHINGGKWRKVEQQVRRACMWRRSEPGQVRTPYPMTERALERLIALYKSTGRVWSMEDLKKGNDGREGQAREKIRAAVQLLTSQGRRVTVRQLMRLSGCCNKTIKRNADIWAISSVVALPSVGGEENPFLDLIAAPVLAPGSEGEEKEVLDPCCLEDSEKFAVTLSAVKDTQSQDPVLELIGPGSWGSGACFPVLNGRWRRRGKATGRNSKKSLASPSRTQPSTGSKHWLGGSGCTCGLNGCPPSSAEPPLGPPHLNPRKIFSKGSGSVMLWEGGTNWRIGERSAPVCLFAGHLFVISQTYKERDSAKPDLTGCLQLARKPAPVAIVAQTVDRFTNFRSSYIKVRQKQKSGYWQKLILTGCLRFWYTRGPPCPSNG